MIRFHPRSDWILALLLLPAAASAQNAHPLDEIRRTAENYVTKEFSGAGGKVVAVAEGLDPRLRLAPCTTTPTAQLPSSARVAARVTVGVNCAQPGWTVYVPVRVETQLQALVLRQAMARNAPVTAADIEIRTQRVPGLSATYISSVEQLAGRHLKRAVPAGTALTVELLAADILVRRGQRVTLLASVGGIEVRAQGEAVQDAGPTGRVRVLNLTSRRIVEGQVESGDTVRVSL